MVDFVGLPVQIFRMRLGYEKQAAGVGKVLRVIKVVKPKVGWIVWSDVQAWAISSGVKKVLLEGIFYNVDLRFYKGDIGYWFIADHLWYEKISSKSSAMTGRPE